MEDPLFLSPLKTDYAKSPCSRFSTATQTTNASIVRVLGTPSEVMQRLAEGLGEGMTSAVESLGLVVDLTSFISEVANGQPHPEK